MVIPKVIITLKNQQLTALFYSGGGVWGTSFLCRLEFDRLLTPRPDPQKKFLMSCYIGLKNKKF